MRAIENLSMRSNRRDASHRQSLCPCDQIVEMRAIDNLCVHAIKSSRCEPSISNRRDASHRESVHAIKSLTREPPIISVSKRSMIVEMRATESLCPYDQIVELRVIEISLSMRSNRQYASHRESLSLSLSP